MLTNRVTIHFKHIHDLCSSKSFPLSGHPLLIQGLRNDINRGFTQDFDDVLGEGARAKIVVMIWEHLDMDGLDPSRRKVGLLDCHHLMAFLVDPVGHEWRATFEIQTILATLMREMVESRVGLDENGLSRSKNRVLREFMVSV